MVNMMPHEAFACSCAEGDVVLRQSYKFESCAPKQHIVGGSSSQPNTNRATSPIHPFGGKNAVRIIPGLAGIFQAAKLYKKAEIREGGHECVMPTQEYVRKIIENASEDDQFSTVQYLNVKRSIKSGCFEDMKTFCEEWKTSKVVANALPHKSYERVFIFKTAKEIWHTLIITHQSNSQVKSCKIDLLTQEYEKFSISSDETIDRGFTRFNAIVTSLKYLDLNYSSKNHVRKFLRALPLKWRAKVTAMEEAKDLATLPLDELIGNLKVYEMVLDNDGVASKTTKEKVKSLALKAKVTREKTSDDSYSQGESDEKSDSEDGDEQPNDETCLMAIDSQERGDDVGGGVRRRLVMGRWYRDDDEGGGGCDRWPEAVEGGDEVEMV
nr:UBN2 domain-containing protein [Tanacetum cinerariifolium]